MYVDREPRFYASVHYNGRPVLSAITVDDRNYFSSDKNKDGFGRAEYYYSGSSGAGTQMTDFSVTIRQYTARIFIFVMPKYY